MGRELAVITSVFSLALLGSCDANGGFGEVTEEFHYSYPLQSGGQLELTNTNGSVEITGWDRDSIDVSGTKYAPEQAALAEIKVRVSANGNRASVETEMPKNYWHGSRGVRFHVRVPRKIRLERAETTNGSVTVEDLEGGGRIRSTNGKLTLARLAGDYDLQTTNGSIQMEDCSGAQKAETTNGGIRGRIRQGAIQAQSTNGTVDLTVDKPMDSRPIRASTTNGSLTLALAEFHGNPVNAETSHGSVTLRLPSDTNANLEAETSMASISNDLSLSSVEERSKHALRGRLGSGGPSISASTHMGSIRIQRY
ncbi:MAG: DUF4097 family beta strand repeat-containing protein [Bryobacteraceae bacterium]